MKLTLQQVYDYLNSAPGHHFTSAQVAKEFDTRVQETTPLLRELVNTRRIKAVMPVKTSFFYTLTQAEIDAANQTRYIPPFNPYVQKGPHWANVSDRLVDYRKVKSLIRSSP